MRALLLSYCCAAVGTCSATGAAAAVRREPDKLHYVCYVQRAYVGPHMR